MSGRRSDRDGEFELIERIRRLLPDESPNGLAVGLGDDCAAVETTPGRLLLVTVDALVEERHFTRRTTTPAALGMRLASVNLSDVAAMGGVPRWAVLSLAIPEELAESWTERIAAGAIETLGRFGSSLVGGNLASAESTIVADLTVFGEVEPDRVLRRAGARPGDRLLVTGRIGAAAAGRAIAEGRTVIGAAEQHELLAAHRRPVPRILEGRALSATRGVHAAIDVSDGLVADARHIAGASGVDLTIRSDRLPVPHTVRQAAAAAGVDALHWALAGGEDYELLFACDPERVDGVRDALDRASGTTASVIGEVVPVRGERPEVRVIAPDGSEIDSTGGGWDHFRRGSP
jgi:thiamine-monophosphate kinase